MAMSVAKIHTIINYYEGIILSSYPGLTSERLIKKTTGREQYAHMLHCIETMREMLNEGGVLTPSKREKIMRWLGFLQGALWANSQFGVQDLEFHNRNHEEL
jgi:hypothetical protein